MRLLVDDESKDEGQRYKVTDIVLEEVENKTLSWSSHSQDASEVTLKAGKAAVQLSLQPFRLTVSVDGKAAVVINSRDMFEFEHRRVKQVFGSWGLQIRASGAS